MTFTGVDLLFFFSSGSWSLCRLRKVVESRRGWIKLHTWEHLVLGGLSGACAASATMPLDFAKTTIQCGSSQPVSQVLQAAVREHGPAGLFRGMVSRDCTEAFCTYNALLCMCDPVLLIGVCFNGCLVG